MSAVMMLLRVQRAALRSWIGLALLLALVGGGVLAAGAGARRTDSAYPRFLQAGNAPDVLVTGSGTTGNFDDQTPLLRRVERLPQVAQAAMGYWALVALWQPDGRPMPSSDASTIVLPDARYGRSIGTFKLLDGRLADPGSPGEVTVSFPFADQFHVRVGDSLRIQLARRSDVARMLATAGPTSPDVYQVVTGPELRVRVAGIMSSPLFTDFPPLPPQTGGAVYFTPPFLRQHSGELVTYAALAVTLHRGQAGVAAFERAAESAAAASGTRLTFQATSVHEDVVQNTLHLQALAVGLLAALAAAVLLLVLGQGVVRRVALDAADNLALRALGATRAQLWVAAMGRAAVAGLSGAAGAALLAYLLSPLTPVGRARLAEPDPGFDLDVAVVLGGAAALALLVLATAAVPAWRAARSQAGAGAGAGGWRLGDRLAHAGFPVTATSGVRLATDPGHGRSAVPVRSAITACAVAAATVAGALCFSASLGHLLDSPRLYGWNWDLEVGDLIDSTNAATVLAGQPAVAAFSQGASTDVGVDAERVGALAMDPGKGSVGPVVLSGRVPQAADEILLGSRTDPGVALGGTVDVHVGAVSRRMRLVGRGVLPILGDTAHLGTGAWLTFAGLRTLLGDRLGVPDTFLVRTAGDPAAARTSLLKTFGPQGVIESAPPQGLVGFGDLNALPLVVAGVLAAGAVATLAHAVATAVRRRRRELAILRTLGFVGRQMALTVAWQATTIAAVAAVVGIPLGAAAGRWAWTLFAEQQGMVVEPVTPLPALLLLLPGALLLGNLVAAIPGRYAARTSPALVLRTE